jgi:hypothetical protein
MTFDEWKIYLSAFVAEHADIPDPSEDTIRRVLIELHRIACRAPNAVLDAYRGLTEQDLERETEVRVDSIFGGKYWWQLPVGTNEKSWMLAVGAQIRALDRVLFLSVAHLGPPSDSYDWHCASAKAFIVPRKRLRQASAAKLNSQSFSRRGLLHHRILPQEVNGYEVRLIHHDTISYSQPSEVTIMGAALFSNLKLETTSCQKEGFIVRRITSDNPEATVALQIEKAIEDGCFGVVWPELTIPPALRNLISKILSDRALGIDRRPAPQVIIAGTWHEKKDGGFVNLAKVIDGYGSTKLVYEKALPFLDRELGNEYIQPGKTLPLLVTDDLIIAFAICRDYCDLSPNLPYPELDVDLVLVPSMGNEATMEGHQVTAKRIRVLYDARTFVVQQAEPQVAGELGLVLPMPDDPAASKPGELRQFDVWGSYAGRRDPI